MWGEVVVVMGGDTCLPTVSTTKLFEWCFQHVNWFTTHLTLCATLNMSLGEHMDLLGSYHQGGANVQGQQGVS